MLILLFLFLGVILGSFINALIWRIHEQALEVEKTNPNKSYIKDLSILKGRSICPKCKHRLSSKDLIPVFSWLSLSGKCRYCKKPISRQYIIVEILTGVLFALSYVWWPVSLSGSQITLFIIWLFILVGLIALILYDLKWLILPNRIIHPLSLIALIYAVIVVATSTKPLHALINEIFAVLIGGGLFYLIFQISSGKWIGGGDVRLGFILGLIAGTPGKSILFIFLASVIGTLVYVPLLMTNKLNSKSVIPFGPLLIVGLIITQFFGTSILNWYQYHVIVL